MKTKYIKSNFRAFDVHVSVVNDFKLHFNIVFVRDEHISYCFTVYDILSLILLLRRMTCLNNKLIMNGVSILKSGRYNKVVYLFPVDDLPF